MYHCDWWVCTPNGLPLFRERSSLALDFWEDLGFITLAVVKETT